MRHNVRMKKPFAFFDGRFLSASDAAVPLNDTGLVLGAAVTEQLRTFSGRLFHLHVHYKLILGEQYVKNYHFPIEEHILDGTQEKYGVRIPLPEVELVILSIRALLKYRDRDVIKDVFMIRYPGVPEHILDEILWLLAQTTLADVEETIAAFNACRSKLEKKVYDKAEFTDLNTLKS